MRYIGFMGVLFFMLNWMFQHDCMNTYCFWVSYMHAFSIFVLAPVQRHWACFTWKSALEIPSLLFLLYYWLPLAAAEHPIMASGEDRLAILCEGHTVHPSCPMVMSLNGHCAILHKTINMHSVIEEIHTCTTTMYLAPTRSCSPTQSRLHRNYTVTLILSLSCDLLAEIVTIWLYIDAGCPS